MSIKNKEPFDRSKPIVSLQYVHKDAHLLQQLAVKFGIMVVFKFGNKLGGIPAKIGRRVEQCGKSGHTNIIECSKDSVYSIPLSCGSVYIGQSGRCVNKRLFEHKKACETKNASSSINLVSHLVQCKNCTPNFSKTEVLARNGNRRIREIMEASQIIRGGIVVISKASIKLSKDEANFIVSG